MMLAVEEAKKSNTDVPVGAIIVKNGKIIAKSCNQKEQNNDPTAHAEILAIKQAAEITQNWRLTDVSMYVTLEPCPMCASAILYSRIPEIYFGAYDTLYGAMGSVLDMRRYLKFSASITGGIQEDECQKLLQDFFKQVRH